MTDGNEQFPTTIVRETKLGLPRSHYAIVTWVPYFQTHTTLSFHHHRSCHACKLNHFTPSSNYPRSEQTTAPRAPRHVSPEDPSRMLRKSLRPRQWSNDILDCGLTSIDRSPLRNRSTGSKFCWDVESQGNQTSHFRRCTHDVAGNGNIRTSDMTNPAAHHPICRRGQCFFLVLEHIHGQGHGTWMDNEVRTAKHHTVCGKPCVNVSVVVKPCHSSNPTPFYPPIFLRVSFHNASTT